MRVVNKAVEAPVEEPVEKPVEVVPIKRRRGRPKTLKAGVTVSMINSEGKKADVHPDEVLNYSKFGFREVK